MRRFAIALIIAAISPALLGATQTLFLDGATTERIVVEHDARLTPGGAITLEAWVRPTTTGGCQTIAGKGLDSGYWLGLCGGRISFYPNGINTTQDGSQQIPASEWTHVAATFDGDERRYYVNGFLDRAFTTPGPIVASDQALGLGGRGASDSFPNNLNPFSGHLSEIRIWDRARTQSDIRSLMYVQMTQESAGLIGVWSLEGGPDDRFGRFSSVAAPGAAFSGLDSPPVPHDPLRIRPASPIAVDGRCNDAGYDTSTTVAAWYPAEDLPPTIHNPRPIHLGADVDYLYVCMPRRPNFPELVWSVMIDTNDDGGSTLRADDYRFEYSSDLDEVTTAIGSTPPGALVPRWDLVSNPTGLAASDTPNAEFDTDFEIRIPRSVFSDPDRVFRVRVFNSYDGGDIADTTIPWPANSSFRSPGQWQRAVVDLAAGVLPDFRNPTATVDATHEPGPLTADKFVRFDIEARDDRDIELIELLVDDVVVAVRDYSGSTDVLVNFRPQARYAPGIHRYQARVFDHVGRSVVTALKTFRVLVDGNPPKVSLLATPREPGVGQRIFIVAQAEDPAGLEHIRIRETLGLQYPAFKRCDYGGGETSATCTWTIEPDPRIRRLLLTAFASDSDGFTNETPTHVLLFGNQGVDTDDDGLADIVEDGLCTDRLDPDTDDDGLSDGWEVTGIQFANGETEPLPAYGANPCYPTALLQLDYETAVPPPPAGLANLRNRLRENGIFAYVETHARPIPTAYPQSHLGAIDAAYQTVEDEFYFSPQRNWAFKYGYQRLLPGRSGAAGLFFSIDAGSGGSGGYCSGGTRPGSQCRGDFECPGSGAQCIAGCTSGLREGELCSSNADCPRENGTFGFCSAPCSNRFVSGTRTCRTRPVSDQSYRLFHEFGHTLGIGHGGTTGTGGQTADRGFIRKDVGWDNANYKPNAISAMNYLYSPGGLLCVEPIPDTRPEDFRLDATSQVTFLERTLGDLDERALSESGDSAFARNMRSLDCSFKSPTAVPTLKYLCAIDGVAYEVLSDSRRTLARRTRFGGWNYDVPEHSSGIDWNCNGEIDAGTVAANINGGGDDYWNMDFWNLEPNLRARDEYARIPNPSICHSLYVARCDAPADSCYVFPEAYRSAIPRLASGLDPIDCREKFLAEREGACATIPAGNFSTNTCTTFDRDSKSGLGMAKFWERAKGASGDLGEFEILTEPELPEDLLQAEVCDLQDNNGDGRIDEGCADGDGDGTPDAIDNCPAHANSDQADRDDNGLGDACQNATLSSLVASVNERQVSLTWSADASLNVGYAIYRFRADDPNPVYLGSDYPSTAGEQFTDVTSVDDFYTYVVRAVNLNGQEGEPASVTAGVGVIDLIFSDGFQ